MIPPDFGRLEEDLNGTFAVVTIYYEAGTELKAFIVDHLWSLKKRWHFMVVPYAIIPASSEVYGRISDQRWTEWQLDQSNDPSTFFLAGVRAIAILNTKSPVPQNILWLPYRGTFIRFPR